MTHAIATKRGNFKPVRKFEGQETIAKAGTVLGHGEVTRVVVDRARFLARL